MAEKKEKQMDEKQVEPLYTLQELKQPQSVINLDDPDAEAKITVITKKVVFRADATPDQKMKVLHDLVSPVEKRIEALERFYANTTYTESKEAALAKGNYLTPQIRSTIVSILSNYPAFADDSAKAIFERWMKGFKAKNPNALKVLEQAKIATATPDMGF